METAYESIVQASLAARLRGDVSSVDNSVLKADTVPLFGPWAPIKSEAPLKDKKVNVAISVAAFAVTLFTPAKSARCSRSSTPPSSTCSACS